VELIDQLVRGEVTMPGEGDDVGVVSVGVGVAGDVSHGLAGAGVGVGSQLLEGHLRRVVGDDLAVGGQQEDGQFGVAELLLRG
jgi:hypothetical protein